MTRTSAYLAKFESLYGANTARDAIVVWPNMISKLPEIALPTCANLVAISRGCIIA
jgi:hypothetical protein